MSGIFGLSSYNDQNLEGLIPDKTREAFREYGYFLGIQGPLNRIDYSNDTTTTNRRVASINQYYSGGAGNSNFGYIMGGNKSGSNNITDIKRIDYSNDTGVLSRGGLTIARNNTGATGNSNFGYIAGGNPSSPGYTSTTERINYSNDNTTASIRGRLTIARGVIGTGNSNFGYFGGNGQAPTGGSTVDRIDYSNDSTIALSRGNIQNSNFSFSATGNNNFGYFLTGWGTSSSHRLNYANDTALLSIRGSLSFPKFWYPGSAGNSNFGYSAGGSTTSSQGLAVSTIDRIDYSNDLVVASVRGPLSNVDLVIASTSSHSFGGSPISQYGVFAKPFGYFGGGSVGPAAQSTIDRIDYSNDTSGIRERGSLVTSAFGLSGTGNANFGYFAGGRTPASPTTLTSIQRIDYTNDINQTLSRGNLVNTTFYVVGATSTNNFGYFGGGYFPSTYSTVERLNYSNDSSNTSVRGSLSYARGQFSATGNSNFGYYIGGAANSTIDRINYSNDTATALSRSTLTTTRILHGSTGNQNFAYAAGGNSPSPAALSSIERLDYSSDTTAASVRSNLSSPRQRIGATGNSNFGYFSGGGTPSPGEFSTVDRVDYSNDTSTATTRSPLTLARLNFNGVSPTSFGGATDFTPTQQFFDIQSMRRIEDTTNASVKKRALGSFGYFANGGIGGNVYLTRVDRIDFSNDTTTASQRGPTVALRIGSQATGNTNYGYVSAGYPNSDALTVERIDYSNDSAITSRRGNLTQFHLQGCSLGLGNNNFGYFAGGSGPAFFSTVDRIDYSNDSATASARGPLIAARLGINGAGVGNANFGYIGGGEVPSSSPSLVSSVERITYANDLSKTSIRGPLTRADAYLFATGNSNFGYYFGGGGAPASYNGSSLSIRIDYSNDTATASSRQNLIVSPGKGSATGTSQYGYIVSGFSTAVLRLDYSSDTINSIRGPLSASRYLLGSTTNARSS